MTQGLSLSGLKCASITGIALTLIMLGIFRIDAQFDIMPWSSTLAAERSIAVILCILSLISSVLLAYKGSTRQGMLLVISSLCVIMSLVSVFGAVFMICLIIGLAFFTIETFLEDSKDLTGVFGILVLAYSVVYFITSIAVLEFLTLNPVVLGAVALACGVFGLVLLHISLNEDDEEDNDNGYTY